jgi:hypothetical protein
VLAKLPAVNGFFGALVSLTWLLNNFDVFSPNLTSCSCQFLMMRSLANLASYFGASDKLFCGPKVMTE